MAQEHAHILSLSLYLSISLSLSHSLTHYLSISLSLSLSRSLALFLALSLYFSLSLSPSLFLSLSLSLSLTRPLFLSLVVTQAFQTWVAVERWVSYATDVCQGVIDQLATGMVKDALRVWRTRSDGYERSVNVVASMYH